MLPHSFVVINSAMSILKQEMILFTFQEEMILFTFQEEMILLNHAQSIQRKSELTFTLFICARVIDY